jgi:hypothetical protein
MIKTGTNQLTVIFPHATDLSARFPGVEAIRAFHVLTPSSFELDRAEMMDLVFTDAPAISNLANLALWIANCLEDTEAATVVVELTRDPISSYPVSANLA